MTIRFEDIIASIPQRLNAVVHVGAGYCKELGLYNTLGAKSIFLVEPNEQLLARARSKTALLENVTLINKAVAPFPGEKLLNITSNLRFSSLLEPVKLFEYFPNIEVIERRSVAAITLDGLCSEIDLDDQANNLLVIEVQGLENELLSDASYDTLDQFYWILVRSSREILYSSPAISDSEHPSPGLNGPAYTLLKFDDESPPFTSCLYMQNRAHRELFLESEQLKVENKKLQKEISQHLQCLKTKAAELDEANRSLRLSTKLVAKLNADLVDLQERFRNSVENQQQQHLLLCELKDRLGQATEFYQQLSLEDRQFDGDVLEPRTSKFVGPEE